MEKVQFRFHVSDGYLSYTWMQGCKQVGYVCYDLRNGVFTAQAMPASFGMVKKARTYLGLLKHAISVIKEIQRYEKES